MMSEDEKNFGVRAQGAGGDSMSRTQVTRASAGLRGRIVISDRVSVPNISESTPERFQEVYVVRHGVEANVEVVPGLL